MSIEDEQIKLVKRLVKSPSDILEEITEYKVALLHCVLGIVGEVFEIFEALREQDKENLLEEAGDLMFYIIDFKLQTGLERGNERDLSDLDLDDVMTLFEVSAGTLLDKTKKIVIYNQDIGVKELLTYVHDIEACLMWILEDENLDEYEAREHNIRKLNTRYPEGYSDQSAQERKDKV